MVVSFCGVVQPRFDAPLLLTASPTIASMSLVGAYAPGVLNGLERHRPTAASGVSRPSSSPPCAHGALSVGGNFQFGAAVVEPLPAAGASRTTAAATRRAVGHMNRRTTSSFVFSERAEADH